ncbi:uncharacterized protein LOC132941196 isoform X1 [Metopolophium dirhodum]|uniref:uncharacterized protein LOC132941196 isoform X1 n=1 Tax=Metopolophium dirhodum TaxID=44670 RepID=UPI00299005E6|nr:uncharacterized protein LOC132941196 isoform X1 [Metopolophium dirhodum]XP_060865120.1 uncharacterized protein LOC132941196 isoform X1 [Metopolophium dirhodum]XP_060865121.1 uncharacterized protein LOC132941196 isoform X1 [Metopolophium dirhodum]
MTIIMNYQLMILVIIIPVPTNNINSLSKKSCVDDMLISPSKNIRTFVKSPSKTPVFESIDDNFCMVKNVSPYRRNKHFVLSPNNLARADKNKKRNLSESPRKVYPSPEIFQSHLSQEISPSTVQKYSPLKTYAQASAARSAVSKQLFRPDNLSQPLTTLLENKQKTPPKPNK